MRRALIILGLLVALLVGGIVVARVRGNGGSRMAEVTGPASDSKPAGSAVPVRPVASPATAAVAAVAMTGAIARAGFISRRELIEGFTTSAFGPVLADETSKQMTALLLELNERLADPSEMQVTEQPLRVRVTQATASAASVEVWSVLVVAPPSAATARVMWRTVSLELRLVGGTWLVDGWKSTPGPTPMIGAESPISSASDVGGVLAWTPVTVGVG